MNDSEKFLKHIITSINYMEVMANAISRQIQGLKRSLLDEYDKNFESEEAEKNDDPKTER